MFRKNLIKPSIITLLLVCSSFCLATSAPQPYIRLQSISEMIYISGLVETRVAKSREGDTYGDYDIDHDHGVWVRPFTSSSKQQPTAALLGYKASNSGISFGIDHSVNSTMTFGVAGDISDSKTTDKLNSSTYTKAKNYQAMLYGGFRSQTDSYLDWLFAARVNNYNYSRSNNSITASSSGHQFSFKALYSKYFIIGQLVQIAPQAYTQYIYSQQTPYTETGNTALDTTVTTANNSLFRMGLGSKISVPISQGSFLLVPGVQAMISADARGGSQQISSQLVSGGTTLVTNVQSGRLLYQLGTSLELKWINRIDIVASLDLERRQSYSGYSAYINLRYIF